MKTTYRSIMKLIFVSLLVAAFFISTAMTQVANVWGWEKTFGGKSNDEGRSVQQTTDGGYIVVGSTASYGAGNIDVYLIKTDASGNKKWQKTFGGNNNDYGYSVRQTNDGGYIVVGNTYSYGVGGSDVYLVKTDASGNVVWQKTFGGDENDEGRSVQQTTNGGYIIAGYTRSYVYLIKTDASGNKEWEETFHGLYEDDYKGFSLRQTSDSGYIIVGNSGSDVYLVKTDDDGNAEWEKTIGYDYGRSVQQTTDGGYIIAGYTESYGAGDYDVYLIKTDASGNEDWEKTFGGIDDDHGNSVQQTTDGGYIVVGDTNSYGAGYSDVYLIKTDGYGNIVWDTTLGGGGEGEGYSVQQTSDGGYIITGTTNSFGAGRDDVYLIKTDAYGYIN